MSRAAVPVGLAMACRLGEGLNEQIAAIVDELGDMITVLGKAEPEHKLAVYRDIGLRLTYHPDTRTVRAESILPRTVGIRFVSEAAHGPNPNRPAPYRPC